MYNHFYIYILSGDFHAAFHLPLKTNVGAGIDVTPKFTTFQYMLENAPVTMVTSVPLERERDITENSLLWELLPFNLS